jgi:hypothetical protein
MIDFVLIVIIENMTSRNVFAEGLQGLILFISFERILEFDSVF